MFLKKCQWKLPPLKTAAGKKENNWWLFHPLYVPIFCEGRSRLEYMRYFKRNTVNPKEQSKTGADTDWKTNKCPNY